ncbi:hypothetical protein AB1Y20_004242 [Prymnesium parvum]|uniref:Uncharacterized protein n=1 Tax=Prymnesium parvum TaxID=97485 RepID=A0AB34J964_PRYPA
MARRSTKQMPLSIFATPAVRGFGEAGFMDADDDLHGLQSVLVARTSSMAKVWAPCFGFLTTTNRKRGGGKAERGAFFCLQILCSADRPDAMIVRGMWIIDKPDLAKFYDVNGILAGHDSSRKVFERMRDDECLLDTNWRDTGGFAEFEPGMAVKRSGDRGDDLDTIILTAIMRRHKYGKALKKEYLKLESIRDVTGVEDWSMQDLLDLLPDKQRSWAPAIEPAPPSGLRMQPSFGTVAQDACMVGDQVIRIGGAPGRPLHCVRFRADGHDKFGWPQGQSGPGAPFVVRQLLTPAQVQSEGYTLPEAWQLDKHELFLTHREVQVPLVDILGGVVVLPHFAFHKGAIDGYWPVFALAQVQLVADGSLAVIHEPVTMKSVNDELRKLICAVMPNLGESTRRLLRNECRLQMTNEKQDNLRCARATLHGLDYGRWLSLGLDAEPTGNRALTEEYYFKDADDIAKLWPAGCRNGWLVPEAPPDARGRKRRRLERHCGVMVVFAHEDNDYTNKATYCVETKEANFWLSLGFYGTNLKYIDGAKPPPRPDGVSMATEFDIVTGAYVDRHSADAWTEGRADAHFGVM